MEFQIQDLIMYNLADIVKLEVVFLPEPPTGHVVVADVQMMSY